MDRRPAKETTCKHCGEVFPSKGSYQVHFRRYHQNNIKTQNINEFETTKLRSEMEKFECVCGKSYEIYQSIRRHQKSCQQWKVHQHDRQHSLDPEEGIITIKSDLI